jgi:hypothetical protein
MRRAVLAAGVQDPSAILGVLLTVAAADGVERSLNPAVTISLALGP